LVFYRVGQESLSNIARHAQAQQVKVFLQRENGSLSLEVIDDGVGFDPTTAPRRGPHGLGLLGMRERLAMINGALTIETAPGKGVRLLAWAPLKENAEG
jgi:signal transduction histidine kinase